MIRYEFKQHTRVVTPGGEFDQTEWLNNLSFAGWRFLDKPWSAKKRVGVEHNAPVFETTFVVEAQRELCSLCHQPVDAPATPACGKGNHLAS